MPKIYELAKDLDMGSLELVEKLKSLGFNLRSHMSALSDEQVAEALSKLSPPKLEPKKKTKTLKKNTAKKKVVSKKKVTLKKVGKRTPEEKNLEKSLSSSQMTPSPDQHPTSPPKDAALPKTSDSDNEEVDNANESGISPKVLRKKASKIAKERAQRAKERETSREEITLEEKRQPTTPSPRKGLQVIFDPNLGKKPEENQKTTQDPPPPSSSPPTADWNKTELHKDSKGKDKEDERSKKRMGALSQMMTKGKKGGKDLIQMRADEEMRTHESVIGKVNYTPVGRKKVYSGLSEKTLLTEIKDEKKTINFNSIITGEALARKLKVKFKEFAVKALSLNLLLKPSDYIGPMLAGDLSELYGYRIRDISFREDTIIGESISSQEEKDEGQKKKELEESLSPRNPVITIMGHVDHGKTTLLDALRKSKVAQTEAGGITQHVGAYQVDVKGQKLTFLDTPGHAAFAAMRERGANLTDIVILVVAADDGVMPQTEESIGFCRRANVPMVIAINKMDKEGANPDRIQQKLTEFELVPEAWGGDTQYVNISAIKAEGLDDLLETVKLVAEMQELRGSPKVKAEGVVIESKVTVGRGAITTALLQKGTLHQGDYLVAGETYGRARSLLNFEGTTIKEAEISDPVQILGLQKTPAPGDKVHVVKNEREALRVVKNRIEERKQLASVKAKPKLSLEDFFSSHTRIEGEVKTLKLLLRTDVQGSYEAIKGSVEAFKNDEVAVEVIGGGVGAIVDNDVLMASGSQASIIGFNMRPLTSARQLAEEQGVEIRTYAIIYELIDDVKAALEGLLEPAKIETYVGRATVKEIFVIPGKGTIAGCSVIDGKVKKDCHIRLLRDGKIMFTGKLASLRRFKDNVKEVSNGLECGMGLDGFNDIKPGDIFEAFFQEEKKRTLADDGTIS